MKKALIVTTMLVSLGAGQILLPVSVNAAEATPVTSQESQGWLSKLQTQIDLAQAKVSALRAQIALEIENSPKRAKQALDDAHSALLKAKNTASDKVSKGIDDLHEDISAAQDAVTNAPSKARKKIGEIVDKTEDRIKEYGQVVADTDEAKALKKRYAQLQAQAALMKAQLAEKVDKTGEKAQSHLDKAKFWYANAKANASKKWHDKVNSITDRIDAVKKTIKDKRDHASEAISNLAKKAANLVRGDSSKQPEK